MRYFNSFIFLFLLVSYSFSNNKINYLEPCPEANFVNINNNIIVGFEKPVLLSESELRNCIIVRGSENTEYIGTVKLSGKNKIIFKSSAPFKYGERITVKLAGKLLNSRNGFEYSFNTLSRKAQWDPSRSFKDEIISGLNTVQDPQMFVLPQLTVEIDIQPSNGYLFLSPYTFPNTYLEITDRDGIPYWYSAISFGADFKKQPNGHLTYFDGDQHKHFEMDEDYNIVNSYYCGNGYMTDIHELRLLSNGNALVMAYDPEIVDMRHYVQGGDSNATVIGLILQEVDQKHEVVFQWRSWDHFAITDALHENLLAHNIDAVHGNAIEIDNDGNLLLSSRHLDEITKINRETGDIIWRLGGLHNQFTFVNDPEGFTYQHAIRRIDNGNITLYDNGNFHTPQFSRAVEYSLDENEMIATLVWEYRNDPDIFGPWGGYVERLSTGNTLICWGGTSPTVTEVKPDGTIEFEATYPTNIYTYRAYKFDWNGGPVSINNNHEGIPKAFKLYQNYPNPFNPFTRINYDIAKPTHVELSVFDITGKEVSRIVSGYLQPGRYTNLIDGSQFSSGIYFCRLTAGDYSASQKMILLK